MLFNYNFCLQEYLQREKYRSARLENFASGLELISQKVFFDIIVLYLLQLTSAVRLKGCFCLHFRGADCYLRGIYAFFSLILGDL